MQDAKLVLGSKRETRERGREGETERKHVGTTMALEIYGTASLKLMHG